MKVSNTSSTAANMRATTAPYLESAGGMWDLFPSVGTEEDMPPAGGACADVDPELFFPLSYAASRQVTAAKQICAGCPVLTECRVYGMGQSDGIFGGLTPDERRDLRRQQKREREELERHASIAPAAANTTDSDYFAMGA